ncbi:hypothetical protein PCI56_15155 [Plesiomonas shigelloides subsp. oncorhynchi]|nr:hypothetical protein [Plesiomonas shigelloides]
MKMDLDLAYLQSRLHTQGGDETFYSRTAFTDVNMDLVTATGWGRHALIGKFSGGALISDDPLAGLLRPKTWAASCAYPALNTISSLANTPHLAR